MIPILVCDSLKFHRGRNIFIFIQSIGTYLLIIFLLSFTAITYKRTDNLTRAAAPIYKVIDNFIGEEERNFFAQSDHLKVLDNLYEWEKNNENFTYIIANRQPVYIDMDLPNIFLQNDKQEDVYKSIQINHNFIDYFSIKTQAGRIFIEEDYNIDNKVMPIILGSEYMKYFTLNQTLDLWYLEVGFKCEIIGFLEDGSYYNDGYNLKYLDEHIIMPSLEVDDIYKEDGSFMLKLFLDKGNGYITTEYSLNDIQQMLIEKCIELDILPYSIEGVSNFFLTMWGLEGKQLQKTFILFFILIGFSTLFSISLNLISKIIANRYNYCIMIINGLDKKSIGISIFIEILIINLSSLFIAFMIANSFMNTLKFLYVFIFSIVLTILSSIVPCILIKKIELTKMMKGKN